MELSEGDSEKWSTFSDYLAVASSLPTPTASNPAAPPDYELVGSICQAQRRLTPVEIEAVVARFQAGESMAKLAREFGCNRRTISGHLRAAGLSAPRTTFTVRQVDEMVRLYAGGLSLIAVGERVNASGSTVRNCLRRRGIALRDSHGRTKS